MQKWSELPSSEDAIDVVLNVSPAFFRKHGGLLAKALPPLAGFGIFLLYFYRNHFYPSFDLFQFSSLLLAAACIGFAIVGAVVFTMVAPGAAIFHLFMNSKDVKEDFRYAMPYSEAGRSRTVWELVVLAYFAPFSAMAIGIIAALVIDPSLFALAALLWPAVIALGFGIALQLRFDLPRWSFLNYGWTAYLALLVFVLLLSTVFQTSMPIIQKLDPVWHYPLLWAVPLVLACMVSICSMAHFAGWSAALHFGLFFGLFVAGYSGIVTTLPEKAVKGLGLGAYEAELISLDPTFCDRGVSELGVGTDCTLRNVHIVWSFGESVVLRPTTNDNRHLHIPAKYIRAMVR